MSVRAYRNGGHMCAILVPLGVSRGTETRLRCSMKLRTPRVFGTSDIDQTLPEDDLRFLMAE